MQKAEQRRDDGKEFNWGSKNRAGVIGFPLVLGLGGIGKTGNECLDKGGQSRDDVCSFLGCLNYFKKISLTSNVVFFSFNRATKHNP